MNELKDLTMEEKRQTIMIQMELLKDMLMSTGLAIGFDKTNNRLLFLDRELYITAGKTEGFGVSIEELSY